MHTKPVYCGRIAPTPSGWLHLGHAATFTVACQRARQFGGRLIYRSEDLDQERCKPDYIAGAIEDLKWWGLDWDDAPVSQSLRRQLYRHAIRQLAGTGLAYKSPHPRSQLRASAGKTSPVDGDLIFPDFLRQPPLTTDECDRMIHPPGSREDSIPQVNIRFRVPDGRAITFEDNRTGSHTFVAGRDFGDFIIWRKDGIPSYELAVVVDDFDMNITEVVRGEDLLLATARQLLLYEALGWQPPQWYHCQLIDDPATGYRMSKTHKSLSLKEIRAKGLVPGREPEFYFNHLDLTG